MGECQSGHRIGIKDGEAFERLEENLARVDACAVIGTMRSDDELRLGTARDVGLEELIRIVEERDDDGEAGEVVLQLLSQRSVPCEEPGERAGFDGADFIDQSTVVKCFSINRLSSRIPAGPENPITSNFR